MSRSYTSSPPQASMMWWGTNFFFTFPILLALYRCETWSLTLQDEQRLKVPKEYLEQRGRKQQEAAVNCMRSPMICTLHQILLGWSNQDGMGREHSTHVAAKECVHIVLLEDLNGGDHLGNQGTRGTIFNLMLQKWGLEVWTGFIWLKTGAYGGLLWTW
jgi:hypothetical protein